MNRIFMTQTLTAEEFFLTLDLSFLVFLFAEVGVSAQEPPVRTRNADSGEQAGATIPHESSPCCKILSSRGSWRAVPGHGDMESLRNDVQKRWIFDKSSAVVFNGVALKTHQSNFEKTKNCHLILRFHTRALLHPGTLSDHLRHAGINWPRQ